MKTNKTRSLGIFWLAVLGYINIAIGTYFFIFPLPLQLEPIDAATRIIVFLLYAMSSNAILAYTNCFSGIKFLNFFGIKLAVAFNFVSALSVIFGTAYPRGVKPMLGWFMASYAVALFLLWSLSSSNGLFKNDT